MREDIVTKDKLFRFLISKAKRKM